MPTSSAPSWTPAASAVAPYILSRLPAEGNTPAGAFSDDASPSLEQVEALLEQTAREVEDYLEAPVPEALRDEAARLTIYRVAALIATSLDDPTTEPSSQERRYTAVWLEGLPRLRERIRPVRWYFG